ncbi:MAG: hypothetical protein KA956_15260, partial [Pyrinomonadaceae bacterium]|nr:hypothetical protein [Pyrinomonadaceae bacterium]
MPFEELNQNGNASHNAEKHNEEILTPEELREYVSLVIKSPDKTYSVESSQQFSQYLNKEASSRYKAIVLDAWNGDYDSLHFEVGLVQVNNTDHRNGVVHALHVSPFHVNFIAIEEPFFEYMHTHIYDAKAQVEVLEYQHKKQSQKTKNWGEGQSFLTDEQTSTASAAAAVDFESEAEEWIDLTDPAEYEQNIKRNEAELTTQEFIRLILTEFLRSGSSDMHIEAGQPTGRIRFRY